MRNTDPFAKWNNPMDRDNPFKPWNDPMNRDDPFAPWNQVGSTDKEYEEYCNKQHIPKRDR